MPGEFDGDYEPVVVDPGERDNNLLVAGALFALLQSAPGLDSVEVVMDEQGQATNQIDIGLSFMLSQYRITVERVKS